MIEREIAKILKEARKRNEEHLRKEMDEAIENPDMSPELRAPDDEFQQIMKKIRERGIKPYEKPSK